MTHRSNVATRYLEDLARKIGARRAVVASADGLLVVGTGGPMDDLEELAAYAPSQLPTRVQRPAGLETRRVEISGERLYVATLGAKPTAEAAQVLAEIFDRPS